MPVISQLSHQHLPPLTTPSPPPATKGSRIGAARSPPTNLHRHCMLPQSGIPNTKWLYCVIARQSVTVGDARPALVMTCQPGSDPQTIVRGAHWSTIVCSVFWFYSQHKWNWYDVKQTPLLHEHKQLRAGPYLKPIW